ncbi:hypothetical protein ALC56_02311 [Trachymyrmex septentrionalis]|uniref:Reverse transcriptase domain-containing protein n=1 Tax=Trachymyrmex septentrionalis TaxID=34720 RepID=A0A151K0N3_9HYME|nr:hypothetical protein ALC56_02311 [Trachymyrmex septentrionalis]
MSINVDILFYYRYVDDICTAVSSSKIDILLQQFNSFYPQLQFTTEIGGEKINFLDITISINKNHFIFISYNWVSTFKKSHRLVFNSDQSFQLEIHSGRSLSNEGVKKVECVVQSISSITHSYTIQSIISCNGNLLLLLFIVLKKNNLIFTSINVIVKASKSDYFKMLLEETYFPNIESNSVLLIDLWTGHCPNII